MADYVLDIHSGGKSLDFLPFAAIHRLQDKQQESVSVGFMNAFGAPYRVKMLDIDAGGMYDTEVERQGKVFVTTELGGGRTTTPYSVRIAKRGVDNFLKHAGILDGEIEPCPQPPVSLDMPDGSSFLFSQHSGLLEPVVTLGDSVKKGELMACIHITERTAVAPYQYFAPRDGLVLSRHVPSLVKMGDCLNVIAEVIG